jgi:uncharacterized membrane protein/glutaredoxin
MMRVTLFTREDCTLCEQVKADLESLADDLPHELQEVNIDNDPELYDRYNEKIPVCFIGPYTLEAPIRKVDLEVALRAAADSPSLQAASSSSKERSRGVRLNQGLLFFARHWLAIFNLIVFLYVGLPFGAPILMEAGIETPAKVIYRVYRPLCHQLSFRSWFLFGQQAYYPLEHAGLDVRSYEQVTGNGTWDWREAQAFLGNEETGYKVALCQRDMAIYGAILLAGLLFGLVRKRIRPLPIWIWFLLGIVPIALDGGSQLIASLPLLRLPVRESVPALRTLSGALFGVMNVWLAYPYVEETMHETRTLIINKLAVAGKLNQS